MAYAFGANMACFFSPEEERVDPRKPDPRACTEMDAFDRLEPELRAQFANSRYGASVAATVLDVIRRGASDAVKRALKERGLFPCDVGTEGVIAETVRILDDRESRAVRAQLVD